MKIHEIALGAIVAVLALIAVSPLVVAQPPAGLTGQPAWSFTMQTDEFFTVGVDFKNYLTSGAHIENLNKVEVRVIRTPSGAPSRTPTPTLSTIVEHTATTGTQVNLDIDGTKTVSGTSYQIDINVTGSDGRIVSWPVRLDSWNVNYRP